MSNFFNPPQFLSQLNLISRTVGGNTAAPTEQFYVYDGQNLLLVLNAQGVVQERYFNGPAVDQVLACEITSGASAGVEWMLADYEGSIRDVATYSGSTIKDHLVYDSFGTILSQSSSQYQPRFTYTAQELDSATGLYYDSARWYDPRNGNFISEDPLGFGGGDTNLSRYCGNSPTNYIDPSGMDWLFGEDPNSASWQNSNPNFMNQRGGPPPSLAEDANLTRVGNGMNGAGSTAGESLSVRGQSYVGELRKRARMRWIWPIMGCKVRRSVRRLPPAPWPPRLSRSQGWQRFLA